MLILLTEIIPGDSGEGQRNVPYCRTFIYALVTVWLTVFAAHAGPPEADTETSVSGDGADVLGLLNMLGTRDAELYRSIFELQEDGQWTSADALIGELESDILMGHVLFQRYMHPTDYRSRFSELRDWLRAYADHPGADRIYRLARIRQGNAAAPPRPEPRKPRGVGEAAQPEPESIRRTRTERRLVNTFKTRIRRELRRSEPERAEKRYWAFERRGLLNPLEQADALTDIASSYFFHDNNHRAFILADHASRLAGPDMAQPDWIAGLAAWKLGRCDAAAGHFDFVSTARTADPWTQAGGAYWAARSLIACQRPGKATDLLRRAAEYKYTFYGILATEQLGLKPGYDWSSPVLTGEEAVKLGQHPEARRAVALAQAGRHDLADDELRLLHSRRGESLRRPIVHLASALGTSAAQYWLTLSDWSGAFPDSVRYPVPGWLDEDLFTVDRALTLAIMRQESGFLPRAHSYAGARGLMQLMPATASYISNRRALRWSQRYRLYEPELNVSLGQQYISYLLDSKWTEGDLLKLFTAYNGGPGNLSKWETFSDHGMDPLIFIESIPVLQTRHYIERVFANLWIYRHRLGQPAPSLEALVAGAWAPYEPVDDLTNPALASAGGGDRQNFTTIRQALSDE